ncbi:MAG: single-stranded-DNA-specific exonuclease RecJ [candidate division WOR-3 bacterium]
MMFRLKNSKSNENIKNEYILEVLKKRGISNEYIDYMLNANMNDIEDPLKLENVDKATDLIIKNMKEKRNIIIHGDYDADGITSLALLYRALRDVYDEKRVIPYIPSRFKEGYGFSESSIKLAKEKNSKLIITVDCGITGIREVEKAINENIDVIITDHHEPLDVLPKTSFIIHPKLSPKYKFKQLTGVGVTYKLILALYKKLNKNLNKLLWDLDLVALGTVADMGNLIYENRIFVKYGLKILRESKKAGIKAITNLSGIKERISPWHISFILAPRINAAGRLSDPMYSFNLLTSRKGEEVESLSKILNELNRKRQYEERKILESAITQAKEKLQENRYILLLSGYGWHEGVIGIVASKICEKFNRPTIIIAKLGEFSKGSCRSIKGFHIQKALKELSYLLEEFGGHELAAGFSIRTENIEKFENEIEKIARREIKDYYFKKDYKYELELNPYIISKQFIIDYVKLSPFGIGNEHFVFLHKNLKVTSIEKYKRSIKVEFSNSKFKFKTKIFDPEEEWLKLREGEIVDLIFSFNDIFLSEDGFNIRALKFSK